MADVKEGKGTMPYGQRADLYGNASIEASWAGFVAADLSHNRWLRWVEGAENAEGNPVEHCVDCDRLSGKEVKFPGDGGRWGDGVYSANEIMRSGIFPGSGRLTCTTRCQCRLEPFAMRRKFRESGKITPFVTASEKPAIRARFERHKARHAHRWMGRKK